MSLTNAPRAPADGFTLAELMISLSLMAVLITGVVSAWIFLGRNFSRLVNTQEQGVKTRRVLKMFTQDLSSASSLTTATATQIVLNMPDSSGGTSYYIVTYTYTSGSSDTGTLTRSYASSTAPSTPLETLTLLSNLRSFTFNFYNEGGTAITPNIQSVKGVDFTYTTATGTTEIGTKSVLSVVSPRIVMRNKSILQ